MFTDLLIDTGTIQTLAPVNSGGDVSTTGSSLYADIPIRINELTVLDYRFIEGKDEYSKVRKKAFIEGDKTGVEVGMSLISSGKTYRIELVKELKDATGVHHFELFLSIIE